MRSADIDRCDSEFRPDGPVANGGGDPAPGADAPAEPSDGLADEVTRLQQERDEYLDLARRARAEFENYRKRTMAQQAEQRDSAAAEVLASVVVPALDVLEAGVAHHPDAVEPIYRAVRQLAEGQGLERLDPAGAPFRPEEHEAVVYRDDSEEWSSGEVGTDGGLDGEGPADGAGAGPAGGVGEHPAGVSGEGPGDGDGEAIVTEVLRPGYRWRGRLVRPASVVVSGGRR